MTLPKRYEFFYYFTIFIRRSCYPIITVKLYDMHNNRKKQANVAKVEQA